MTRDDGFTRYTVRLPDDLYRRLKEAAGVKSVNAEIAQRLEGSFDLDLNLPERMTAILRSTAEAHGLTLAGEIERRLGESLSGRFETVDAEHRNTGDRLARMERQMTRLLSQITSMRERSEFVQSHPERLTPERVARRAGIRDGLDLDPPVFQNPFPSGTIQADEYRHGFHQALIRRIGGDAVRADPQWKEILPRRVREALYPDAKPDTPSSD